MIKSTESDNRLKAYRNPANMHSLLIKWNVDEEDLDDSYSLESSDEFKYN